MKYNEMSPDEKHDFIQREHVLNGKSIREIAQELETYPNRLRRDAIALNVAIRGKSEAQSVALKSGRSGHPTKGKKRSDTVKKKISEKRSEVWKNITPEEKEKISKRTKKQWDAMTKEQKDLFRQKAARAVRAAAKNGSKLEIHLHDALRAAGYYVEFHKEQLLQNERLQLDMFLPNDGIAIEVDGPSHFLPIWGNKTLQKNKRADGEKNGLLLTRGLIVIRIQQDAPLSQKYKRDKANALLDLIKECKTNKPSVGNRYFEI